jgi:GNAT superfamily N-acetyltransferase
MSQLSFRAATAEDLPTVLSLLNILNTADDEALSLPEAEAIFTRIRTYPQYVIWLVERGQRLVGTYSLVVIDNLGHRGAPEALVENVAVAEGMRGAGIGAAMMRHAMNKAHESGCYKLVLSSNEARTDAHAFYDKLGFERHGISFRVDIPAHQSSADESGRAPV